LYSNPLITINWIKINYIYVYIDNIPCTFFHTLHITLWYLMFSLPANLFQICQTFPFPIILRGFTEGKWKMCLFYDRKQTLTNLINHTSFERNDLRMWNRICAGFFSLFVYTCIAVGDQVFKRGCFNPALLLCMPRSRTCISNVLCHGILCVQWVKVRGDCSWFYSFIKLKEIFFEEVIVTIRNTNYSM
jgi:hypothetical protein